MRNNLSGWKPSLFTHDMQIPSNDACKKLKMCALLRDQYLFFLKRVMSTRCQGSLCLACFRFTSYAELTQREHTVSRRQRSICAASSRSTWPLDCLPIIDSAFSLPPFLPPPFTPSSLFDSTSAFKTIAISDIIGNGAKSWTARRINFH